MSKVQRAKMKDSKISKSNNIYDSIEEIKFLNKIVLFCFTLLGVPTDLKLAFSCFIFVNSVIV